MTHPVPRLALVGDRSPTVQSHARIPRLLAALAERDGLPLDAYWIPTEDGLDGYGDGDHGGFGGFDAVWLLPGSPYRSEAGALAAVRAAREHGIPFLGTCGGFQHALLEYAEAVWRVQAPAHAELDPEAPDPVIAPLTCSLVERTGTVHVAPGSQLHAIYRSAEAVEGYHCRYGLHPAYAARLADGPLRVAARDPAGDVRAVELDGHPFYVATLYQPERSGIAGQRHPLITAFVDAVRRDARARLRR
jgi:CTP synthase (UTP-ammonia lyase)